VHIRGRLGSILPSQRDPNVEEIDWQVSNPTTLYFPAVRVDYTPNDKLRFNVAWNMTKSTTLQPSRIFRIRLGKDGAGDASKNYSAAFGFDWTLSPTIVNNFRVVISTNPR